VSHEIIARVCEAIAAGDTARADALVRQEYAFEPPTIPKRQYTPRQMMRVFARDGFVDRYSGDRLVLAPVLRLISIRLPTAFPYHPTWKMTKTHPAYWDLTPTIDHLVPVARGGPDEESNWVTTNMARNAAKGNSSLEQIGWSLCPPGRIEDWDGMSRWFLDETRRHPEFLDDQYLGSWARAVEAVTAG
jgi:hypothetical protein